MSALNSTARQRLRDAGITPQGWARRWFGSNVWGGDVCGCPDDRCVGYHHDGVGDCGCLTTLLREEWSR